MNMPGNHQISRKDADVIIVGGGPAGLSTALHLVQKDPAWAKRILLLEKARYPRPKLCGGGITRPGLDILRNLHLALAPAHIPVREVIFRYNDLAYKLESNPAFVVVSRDAFDAWLAAEVQARGVTILQGQAVVDVRIDEGGVDVWTRWGRFRARAVVAADGANSVVRRRLGWGPGRKALLLEVITPPGPNEEALAHGRAIFDWSVLDLGVEGYYWDFPTPGTQGHRINRGIFHSRFYLERSRPTLPRALSHMLSQRGIPLEQQALQGHPIHWLAPGDILSRPRVLLAGDAAGVDPLLGEGISFALAYGQVAADALDAAFATGDFHFADYTHRVRHHWLLKQLRARHLGAAIAFGSMRHTWSKQMLWRAAPFLFRLMASLRPGYFPLDRRHMTLISK